MLSKIVIVSGIALGMLNAMTVFTSAQGHNETDLPVGCWQRAYIRDQGFKLVGTKCPDGTELQYGYCYKSSCPKGFEPNGPQCWTGCPKGFFDCGAFCLEGACDEGDYEDGNQIIDDVQRLEAAVVNDYVDVLKIAALLPGALEAMGSYCKYDTFEAVL